MKAKSLALAAAAMLAVAAPAAWSAPAPAGETVEQMALRLGEGRVSARRLRAVAPHVDAVLAALGGLSAQDRAAEASGAPITRDIVEEVRASIRALVRSAAFNRIPDALLHAMLREGAEAEFSGAVPPALQDGEGKLDAATLLSGVVGKSRRARAARVDADYLAAINGEGARTSVAAAAPASPALTPAAAPVEPAAPDPFAGRIQFADGQRWITVEIGDTLGSIAVGVYGDSLDYQRIYAANRDVLRTPNTIAPGQRLRLPE